MSELASLLFSQPAPLPSCVRRVRNGVYVQTLRDAAEAGDETTVNPCRCCSRYFSDAEMMPRRNGKPSTRCVACGEREKINRLAREETFAPEKTAARIAREAQMMVIARGCQYRVYRKTMPPTYLGFRKTGDSLLAFVRKLAKNT